MMTPTESPYPRYDCAPSLLPGHACDPNHNKEDTDDSGTTAVATNDNDESGDDDAVTTTATPLLRATLQAISIQ